MNEAAARGAAGLHCACRQCGAAAGCGSNRRPAALPTPHCLQGSLRQLDPAAIAYNIEHCTEEYFGGGEAAVYVVRWRMPPGGSPAAYPRCAIAEGQQVAVKVYHYPDGRGGFFPVVSEEDWVRQGGCCPHGHCWQPLGQPHACPVDTTHLPSHPATPCACCAAKHGSRTLRHEMNIAHMLRAKGCGDHLPLVLGIVQSGRPHQLPDLRQEASRQQAVGACYHVLLWLFCSPGQGVESLCCSACCPPCCSPCTATSCHSTSTAPSSASSSAPATGAERMAHRVI